MGVTLTVAQRVVALVAYDGADPCQLDDEHRVMARRIFGAVEEIPGSARRVLVAMCGARGGKSYIFSALYSLWRMLTADLGQIAPGEQAVAAAVAPDKKLARQILRYAKGAALQHPRIKPLIEFDNEDSLTLLRADGREVSLEVLAATRGGSALRGRSLVSAVLDEAAFFRDQAYAVNDVELFNAVAPRVIPGGMVVIDSTPWAESGLLYTLHTANHGKPLDAIAAHAPTDLLALGRRDGAEILSMVEAERRRDPDNAAREYDAVPLAAGTGFFFSPAAIDACITDEPIEVAKKGHPQQLAAAGGDLALRRDSAALAVVHCNGGVWDLVELVERRPTKEHRLRLSVLCEHFAEVLGRHRLNELASDQHEIDAAQEYLDPHHITMVEAPSGASGKERTYSRAREMIHTGNVRIHRGREKLIRQLKEITSTPLPGGGVAIRSPRNQGGHGDLASAFVLALYEASQRQQGTGLAEAVTTALPLITHASRWGDLPGRGF